MIEYISGFISGISQVIIGHPFDTYIIHKQLNKPLNYRHIYKGIQYPLLSTSLINSLSFGLTHNFNKTINNYYLSGFCTGCIMSFIMCPIELYKIRSQTQTKINNKKYFLGLKQTMIRESIGCSMYFGIYNTCRDNKIPVLMSGGISGASSWIITYPFDTIKTRIQSGIFNNMIDCIKYGNLYKGINISILRSLVVNSISFYVYEYTIKLC